jgi:O-antigen ligase
MKTHISTYLPVMLWVGAFICSLYPINAFQLEFWGLSTALLFVWAFVVLVRKMNDGWEIPKSPTLLLAGLFWLLVLVSVMWSDIKPISLMGFCVFTAMPLSMLIGVIYKDNAYFRTVALCLAPVFAVLSVWALIQFFFLNNYFFGQAHHPLGDPSSLGMLLTLALVAALGWMLVAKDKLHKYVAVALVILLCGGIFATAARGPIFAVAPSIAVFVILLWPQIKQKGRLWLSLVVGIGILVVATNLPSENHQYKMFERIGETITLSAPDVSNNRLNIWAATKAIIEESPIIGRGISTFSLYYPEHRLPVETAGTFYAHNDPLQFWVELGIFGPVLFYAFILAAAVRTFSALKKLSKEETVERVVIVSVFAALMSLVIHAHVSFSFYNLSILYLAGFLLSVWFYYTGKVLKDKVIHAKLSEATPRVVNLTALALPFLMVGAVFEGLIAGEHYVNRARNALFDNQMFTFADHINRAGDVSFGMNTRAYLLAVNVPITILDDHRKYASKIHQTNLYNQVIGYMDKVQQINPRSSEAYYYKAKIQQMVDADIVPEGTPSVEELYLKSLQLDPMALGSRLALAEIYAEREADKEAREDVLKGGENFIYTTPLVMEYYELLAHVYLEGGNYVKVNEILRKSEEFKKRSDFSLVRQNTSIFKALMNSGRGDAQSFPQEVHNSDETSGKKESGL